MTLGRSLTTSGGRRASRSARFLASATRSTRVGAVLAVLAVVASAGDASAADEKQACVRASEKAQQLRNASKLVEAREQLVACTRTECPKLVQQDCTQWMSEVLSATPSVVPAAKDRAGRDIVDVRVSIDGKLATDALDGKAIGVDPGVHTLHFETSAAAAIDETVVVKQGEKNRIVTVTFAKGDDATAAGAPGPASASRGAEEPPRSSPPIAAYVVGGIGIVALGAALVVQLGANSDARDLRETCAPRCSQSDVDGIQSRYTVAGVTAGVGGALLITGVVMLLLHRGGSPRATTTTTATTTEAPPFLSFRPSPGGGGAVLRF